MAWTVGKKYKRKDDQCAEYLGTDIFTNEKGDRSMPIPVFRHPEGDDIRHYWNGAPFDGELNAAMKDPQCIIEDDQKSNTESCC